MKVARILDRASRLERLAREELLVLYEEAPVEELAAAAHAARCGRVEPERVTFLVDRNVNYTNVCVTNCSFCAFYRPPGHKHSWVLEREEIAHKLEELVRLGGTRVLLQGGHHPDLRLAWYEDLLIWLRAAFPSLTVDGFSPSEVAHIATVEGIPVAQTLKRLARAGLGGLPGGGGENLVPSVRQRVSPLKQTGFGWLQTMSLAHGLGLVTTATQVIGFDEPLSARVDHLLRLRELQDQSLRRFQNAFVGYISWTMQLEHNALGRQLKSRGHGGDSLDADRYLRHVAVARLALDNIDHHQASWPTVGPETAMQALSAGADDYGSTMLEENVVSRSGSTCTSLAEQTIRERIGKMGFYPAKRDSRYRILAEWKPSRPLM
jgi:cyclic dehypoxanthinyl futalosine synthase